MKEKRALRQCLHQGLRSSFREKRRRGASGDRERERENEIFNRNGCFFFFSLSLLLFTPLPISLSLSLSLISMRLPLTPAYRLVELRLKDEKVARALGKVPPWGEHQCQLSGGRRCLFLRHCRHPGAGTLPLPTLEDGDDDHVLHLALVGDWQWVGRLGQGESDTRPSAIWDCACVHCNRKLRLLSTCRGPRKVR